MLSRPSQTTMSHISCHFLLVVTTVATACSPAGAAEIPSVDEIKAHFHQQREKIESLYIEVKREEKPCVDLEVLLTLPGFTNKILLANDEWHFALKGDKRYTREVWPPDTKYLRPGGQAPKLPPNASPLEREAYKQRVKSHEDMKQHLAQAERMGHKIPFAEGPIPDEAKAYNGRMYWTRSVFRDGKVQFTVSPPRFSMHWFQPPPYLRAVGLAILDPTEKTEAALEGQRMALLPDLLERWPYSVSAETEAIDGAECVVLTGKPQSTITIGEVSETMGYDDKLWLDLEHGLAIRKREMRFRGSLWRGVNSDLHEVLPRFWLPNKCEVESFPMPGAPKELEGRPVMIETLTLTKCVVNEVPDDLFDMVTKPGDQVLDLRDPKFHRP